uniref:AC2 n=1 Tax=Sweet potato leaf curl Sichuan virus 1 TaxID=2026196 RepID=A0A1B1PIC9_9GEMI|nr:AC2 [Sweet potato leaf curl Sichuan virus 1]QIP75680.1 AC2 [Sweet potato leaf curl Sichuan virus 1]
MSEAHSGDKRKAPIQEPIHAAAKKKTPHTRAKDQDSVEAVRLFSFHHTSVQVPEWIHALGNY